uniref:Ribosomal protein S1 n=1 Tax=Thuretia quercifolia TaxID=189650 RepID=A0A1Z1ML98_9FLOR|nr:ribosomal protein S1 [Thuretia quercifolia]ARW66514.1 ribosomal protein S1 [Thuretia quercifolia]
MIKKENQYNNFAYLLKKYNYQLNPGDIVAGTVIYQEKKGFLVNIGDETSGYLPMEEINLDLVNNNKEKNFFINKTRDFFLIKHNIDLKQYILSIKRLEYIRGWKRIKQIQLEDVIFNLKIKHINKGGIITYLEGIQGFIPKSHIYLHMNNNHNTELKNKKIKCKLLVVNEQKNQLILSSKSAILKLSKHKFRIGEIIYGKIVKIKSYGLFIEVYGIIALLHISEIGFKYIQNINDIFYLGKLIKIKIIHIDTKQGRISVSKRNIK